MKANEFRIGNFFDPGIHYALPKGQTHIIVSAIENEKVNGFTSPAGIPITDKWLLRFGFKKSGNDYSISTGKLDSSLETYLHYSIRDKQIACGYDWECSGPPKKFEYVHQLQNLYFALTGEELIYHPS